MSFGAGLSPWMPGSVGALVAFPLFAILQAAPPAAIVGMLALFLVAGVAACGSACAILGKQDHGAVVWDETVGMLLVLFMVPATWPWWAAAYVAFRVFDINKPWPIRLADEYASGGLAVMLDDVLAAIYAIAAIWIAQAIITPFIPG